MLLLNTSIVPDRMNFISKLYMNLILKRITTSGSSSFW